MGLCQYHAVVVHSTHRTHHAPFLTNGYAGQRRSTGAQPFNRRAGGTACDATMNSPTDAIDAPQPLGCWSGVADRAGVADCLAWSESMCAQLPLDEAGAFAMRLAIEEVCVNIGDHGYKGQAPGPMSVTVSQHADPPAPRIEVHIFDRAAPFHPEDAPQPDLEADVHGRRVGGLGWFLIRQLMDSMAYQSEGGENCLTLVKWLPPSAKAPDHNPQRSVGPWSPVVGA